MLIKISAIANLVLALAAPPTLADAGHDTAVGEPASAAQADRVIEVEMDEMAFQPAQFLIEAGETIRFASPIPGGWCTNSISVPTRRTTTTGARCAR